MSKKYILPHLPNTIFPQVSYDHRSYELQFKQLRIEARKSQDFNGVWTRDLTIPVRRSNQLSYEATASTVEVSRKVNFELYLQMAWGFFLRVRKS